MKFKFAICFFVVFSFGIFQNAVSQNNSKIPFKFDAKDFGKVEKKYSAKVTSESDDVKAGFPVDLPAHDCFYLEDKRPLLAFEKGARYFQPAQSFLCFIPTSDTNEKDFAAAYPNFSSAISKLKTLLQNRPQELKQFDNLIDVPYNNAGWSFESKIQYLDYKNVSGVFFLTQYTQELTPNLANNEELTANFQGLTKDGKFYVAVRFATTHPNLPKGIDFTDSKIQEDAFAQKTEAEINKKVREYLQTEQEKVEKLSDETFQPSLISLKKIIASIGTK
jgi:hypothetical protein